MTPQLTESARVAHEACAADLLAFLDASPTPWHAVEEMKRRLTLAGFVLLQEEDAWRLEPGSAYMVERGGGALAAFVVGQGSLAEEGFRLLGAHTDSPGLRVKPRGEQAKGGMLRLGVEVYGGPILATWTDRELGLAGRVSVKAPDGDGGVAQRLVRVDRPLLRLANAAIHLNREVNNKGLVLDKQEELPLLLAAEETLPDGGLLSGLLAQAVDVDPALILAFDLCAVDLQAATLWGASEEFIASGRLDNLAMCHAGMDAVRHAAGHAGELRGVALSLFFDHEEVGSQSATGADGSFLPDVLERVHEALGGGREGFLRACARSFLVSADMAHALHPNYMRLYEAQHQVFLNQGPVIKLNSNLRYSTEGPGAARFLRVCADAEVPVQRYVHRTDLPCGSTIGPMASARLGIAAVDVGNPMHSMHSVRESAGALDPLWMSQALGHFLLKG